MVKYGAAARRRARRCARGSTRCPTRSTSGCCARDAAELRERLEVDVCRPRATPSCWPRSATSAATTSARWSTPTARPTPCATARRVVFAYTIKGWMLPTEGHPANHSALLNAEQYARARRRARHRPRRPVGAVRRRHAGGRAVRGHRRGGSTRPPPTFVAEPPRGAGRPRPRAQGPRVHPAGVRALLRRPRARGARGRRARRHRLARRRHLDEPRRLDQQGRHLVDRRPDRLVRRRHRHARALARVRPRAPHRARDRRGQPRRPARRARRDLVARRPAAAAGRHDLRPVRRARAGAVVVRHLRGRAVDPRRHAERRHARARGRRAPVGDHAVDRDRAARLRRLGAGVRAGPRVDAAARARRGSAARTATRAYLRLSTRPIDQALHTGTREEVLAGGYRLRAPEAPAASRSR